MPKLQQNDDKNLLEKNTETSNESLYVFCIKRKSHPRIHILICDQCKYRKKCAEYQIIKNGPGKTKKDSPWKNRIRIKRKKSY